MRQIVITIVMIIASVGASRAASLEQLVQQTEAALQLPDGSTACFPAFEGPADVFSVSVYEGDQLVDPRHQQQGPRRAHVIVEATDRPALILATAYNPVVWTFDVRPGAKLAGVILSGYYPQFVDQFPAGTPLGRTGFFNALNTASRPCATTMDEAQRLELKQLELKTRDRYRKALKAWQPFEERLSVYGDFLLRLQQAGLDAKGQELAVSVIAAAEFESAPQRAEFEAIKHELDDIKAQISAAGVPARRLIHDKNYFYVDGDSDLQSLAKQFRALGEYDLVSQQYSYQPPSEGFLIARRTATLLADRRASVAAFLATLSPPPADLQPPATARLAAPADLQPQDAVSYLSDRGYVANGTAWAKYACEFKQAIALSEGRDGRDACKDMRPPFRLIQGPITLPSGLFGADSFHFVLPEGVPEPDGELGHSKIFRLADLRAAAQAAAAGAP